MTIRHAGERHHRIDRARQHGRQPDAQRLAHRRRQHSPTTSRRSSSRSASGSNPTAKASTTRAPGASPAKAPARPAKSRPTGREAPPPINPPRSRTAPRRECRSLKPASASPRSKATSTPSATAIRRPGSASVKALSANLAKVERVTLLGPTPRPVTFTQTAEALVITLPAAGAHPQHALYPPHRRLARPGSLGPDIQPRWDNHSPPGRRSC